MTTQSTENVALPNISNTPVEDIVQDLREWFVKGDVARILNSKMRKELFELLTKTELGQRLLSSNDQAGYRLILSPFVLAMNTLVAEFLYSQNCHCALSVYCAEVPYHNTLPYFENTNKFRFSVEEVEEIFNAMSGQQGINDIKNEIASIYEEDENASLLLVMLRVLMSYMTDTKDNEKLTARQTKRNRFQVDLSPMNSETIDSASSEKSKDNLRTEIYNTNFRYLNKYLIILSKNVKEMTQQLSELNNEKCKTPGSRRSSARKLENLNRNLERMTENLKEMSKVKQCSRQVGAILAAIKTLSNEFNKCTSNFETLSKDLLKHQSKASVVMQVEKQTETEEREKSYVDWIYEMRHTANGKKFLEKIDQALNKLIKKQAEFYRREMEILLDQQKELLKMRYNESLLEKVVSSSTKLEKSDAQKSLILEEKLKDFEGKHKNLLEKLDELEVIKTHFMENNAKDLRFPSPSAETKTAQLQHNEYAEHSHITQKVPLPNRISTNSSTATNQEVQLPQPKKTTKEVQTMAQVPDSSGEEAFTKILQPPIPATEKSGDINKPDNSPLSGIQDKKLKTMQFLEDSQKQLEKILQNVKGQDQGIQNVLLDAKLRVKELENESNQLDESIQNYLDRQRKEAEEARAKIEKLNSGRREFLKRTTDAIPKPNHEFRKTLISSLEDEVEYDLKMFAEQNKAQAKSFKKHSPKRTNAKSDTLLTQEYRNPLLEIKDRFLLQQEQKYQQSLGTEITTLELNLVEDVKQQQLETSTVLQKPIEIAAECNLDKELSTLEIVISSDTTSEVEEDNENPNNPVSRNGDSLDSSSDSLSEQLQQMLKSKNSFKITETNNPTTINKTQRLKSTAATRHNQTLLFGENARHETKTKPSMLQQSLTKMQQLFAQVPDLKQDDDHGVTAHKKAETTNSQQSPLVNGTEATNMCYKNEKIALPQDDVNNNKNNCQQQQQQQKLIEAYMTTMSTMSTNIKFRATKEKPAGLKSKTGILFENQTGPAAFLHATRFNEKRTPTVSISSSSSSRSSMDQNSNAAGRQRHANKPIQHQLGAEQLLDGMPPKEDATLDITTSSLSSDEFAMSETGGGRGGVGSKAGSESGSEFWG